MLSIAGTKLDGKPILPQSRQSQRQAMEEMMSPWALCLWAGHSPLSQLPPKEVKDSNEKRQQKEKATKSN